MSKEKEEKSLKEIGKELATKAGCDVFAVKMCGEVCFFRATPTAASFTAVQQAYTTAAMMNKEPAPMALENFVVANALQPTGATILKMIREEPWHANSISERISSLIKTEFIDLEKE